MKNYKGQEIGGIKKQKNLEFRVWNRQKRCAWSIGS